MGVIFSSSELFWFLNDYFKEYIAIPGLRPDPEEGQRVSQGESRKVQQLPEQLVRALRTVQSLLDEVKLEQKSKNKTQKETFEDR